MLHQRACVWRSVSFPQTARGLVALVIDGPVLSTAIPPPEPKHFGFPEAVGQLNYIQSVRIKSVSNLTYDERLIKLGNDRLELRRLRADLLCVIKYYIILLIYTKKIFHYE